MKRAYIREKWNYYQQILAEFPEEVQREARDAFYGGVIAGIAILIENPLPGRDLVIADMDTEAREFLAELEEREEASRGTHPN